MPSNRSPEKQRILDDANQRLRTVAPGGSAFFPLPQGQPLRSSLQNCLCGVALRLWGKGRYSVRTEPSGASVFYLLPPEG